MKHYNLKYSADQPPRFPFQNSTSHERKRERKRMSYIVQKKRGLLRARHCTSNVSILWLQMFTILKNNLISSLPGDFHAIFIWILAISVTYTLAKCLNTFYVRSQFSGITNLYEVRSEQCLLSLSIVTFKTLSQLVLHPVSSIGTVSFRSFLESLTTTPTNPTEFCHICWSAPLGGKTNYKFNLNLK